MRFPIAYNQGWDGQWDCETALSTGMMIHCFPLVGSRSSEQGLLELTAAF